MDELFKPISGLKGVGEKKASYYKRLGVLTVYDLIYHLPRGYIDYSCPVSPMDAPLNEYSVLRGAVVMKMPEQRIRKGLSIFKAKVSDGLNDFMVVIYNNYYGFKALQIGCEYLFYGKVTGNLLRREISSPRIVKADSSPLVPVYHLTTGLTSAAILQNMREALTILEREPFESMPAYLLIENDLMSLPAALRAIHFPKNQEEADSAAKRLAFDEMLILQLGMLMLKEKSRKSTPCVMNKKTGLDEFYASLPFKMTAAQLRCVKEITDDLSSGVPMNRLLQGDVGSGKTAVAAAACYFSYKNGYQSALMAPTEILAVQHYKTLSGFLEPLGIKTVLLTGSMTVKEKRAVKDELMSGEAGVAVGTHAIIQKDVEFASLGLVITDEQHRFGVSQRAALADKGKSPHKLVMSATPIPRTLALIIYGDLDISVIDEMPAGRLPVRTYAVTGKLRKRAFNFVRQQLDSGRQAYIVCPVIEENESDMLAVKSYFEKVRGNDFADYSVGLLHGKMKAAEKESVMEDFKNRRIDVLICTTVVEVGVDIPNASVMMIENAERFGLSQLHQLRGRVGRGESQSHCILVTDNSGEECIRRMKIMSSINDGFKISEEDLKMRGPGDFFGIRQSGDYQFRLADVFQDADVLSKASYEVSVLMKEDPHLEKEEHKRLLIRLRQYAGEQFSLLNL